MLPMLCYGKSINQSTIKRTPTPWPRELCPIRVYFCKIRTHTLMRAQIQDVALSCLSEHVSGVCAQLRTLELRNCRCVTSLAPLAGCESLVQLDMSGCAQLSSLEALEHCTRLTMLNMKRCQRLGDICLQEVDLSKTSVTELCCLPGNIALHTLNLSSTDLSSIES